MASAFRWPGGDQRTTIIGATGSGKSTCGLWMLAHQRLEKRPWIIFDFKREPFFDKVGFPPIQQLSLGDAPPRKPGLYLVCPLPGQDAAVDAFLWRVWQAENIGLYIDEAPLMPPASGYDGFPACIQQGRSKRIPIIACMQRPVGVPRALFEADIMCLYTLDDRRDFRVIEGFVPSAMGTAIPWHHWKYWNKQSRTILNMRPVPHPNEVAAMLNAAAPYTPNSWHPFSVTSKRRAGRDLRLN